MLVSGKHYRTIWLDHRDPSIVNIIDQRHLPFAFVIEQIRSVEQMAIAIKEMHLRGAGLIGAAAGFGMYLAALESVNFREDMEASAQRLMITRPTAVNLAWAVNRSMRAIEGIAEKKELIAVTRTVAQEIADEDTAFCRSIGQQGLPLIREMAAKKQTPVNILTHCNAGWLAFVDYGSATAPVYAAHDAGIPVHVWVDETRPRNQGARLTAWELKEHGVPHTVICDNTGGHLMQHGMVDLVLTGTDRTTRTGDVANKIGTYLKALAAFDNQIPFYVALPSSTFDWSLRDGLANIEIEQRNEKEVKYIRGLGEGSIREILISNQDSPAINYAFDVTPARLITGLITERGICKATEQSILNLFPENKIPEK